MSDRAPPIDPGGTYSGEDVGRLVFGKKPTYARTWFYRARIRLRAEGFPEPISKVGRPRWSGAAILEWERRERQPVDAPTLPEAAGAACNNVIAITSADATLRARLATRPRVRA